MTLQEVVIQNIIRRLLKGEDYRTEILALINADFLQYAIDFFKRVASAKLDNQNITEEWYRKEFLGDHLPTDDIIIHAGLNKKTITNMYNTARREVVLDVAHKYYDELYKLILHLVENTDDLELVIHLKLRGVAVDLNISESLVVINTLAVKRSQIRGGAWSTAGKQVEIPLMKTLCKLFSVPEQHYSEKGLSSERREVDFHLINSDGEMLFCEVKLMGRGNPESADAVIARDTDVFVADKLSDLNKEQLPQRNTHWVELRSDNGYRKFFDILQELNIPCHDFEGDLDKRLDEIFKTIFK